MSLQKTLWRPDTCGCEIEYSWDDTVAQEDRVHDLHSIKKCPIHQGDFDATAYGKVKDENQSKNFAIGLMVKTIAKLDGGQNEIKWRFDENRNVILSHSLLTQKDKDDFNALPKNDIKKQVMVE